MIDWLVQPADACPDLITINGAAPVGFLSTGEQARFAAFQRDKRRRDWLLGRWTAKHLLQAVLYRRCHVVAPLDALEVRSDSDGAPAVSMNGYPALSRLSLSISHSCAAAFCALVERRTWPIGCDIEWIEARAEPFVSDYFTAEEIARVNCAPPPVRDALITATWSAKESALKALRLGLSFDTYAVTCLIPPFLVCPSTWTPFTIQFAADAFPDPPPLVGWWKTFGCFVLTIACQT